MKERRDHNQYQGKQMILKTLKAVICQQIRQPRRNGHISGKPKTTKTGTGRNRKPEQANNQGGD